MARTLSNAFSLNILSELPATVHVAELSMEEAKAILEREGVASAVGHQSTAEVLTARLGIPVPENRVNVSLRQGDAIIVAQVTLPRLAEGQVLTAEQVAAAPIRFPQVSRTHHNQHRHDVQKGASVVHQSRSRVGAVALTRARLSGRTSPEKALSTPEIQELSRDEYAAVRDEFREVLRSRDPRRALTALRARLRHDPALLRSCHALVHDLGHAAYEQHRDFGEALTYQDEVGNSGYLHGVIEAHFGKTKNILATMQSVCSPYPVGTYVSWGCYHGVGHGAMYYTANDLPKSLELCDRYDTPFARDTCINGIFMENFSTDQELHPSRFLKPSDPFYPCPEQAAHQKAACYLSAPTYFLHLHRNAYQRALRWCESAEAPYQDTCVGGVGGQAMKENFHNTSFVERVCMSGSRTQREPCVAGMTALYINHFGSLEPARTLCGRLAAGNKEVCDATIQSMSAMFQQM